MVSTRHEFTLRLELGESMEAVLLAFLGPRGPVPDFDGMVKKLEAAVASVTEIIAGLNDAVGEAEKREAEEDAIDAEHVAEIKRLQEERDNLLANSMTDENRAALAEISKRITKLGGSLVAPTDPTAPTDGGTPPGDGGALPGAGTFKR